MVKKPEEHDYPTAFSYLSLFYDEKQVKIIITNLKNSEMSMFKAKDF